MKKYRVTTNGKRFRIERYVSENLWTTVDANEYLTEDEPKAQIAALENVQVWKPVEE